MNNRAFSLLEVLVALAVISVALASMLEVQSRLTSDAADVEARVLAHWVAQNRVAAMRLASSWPVDTESQSGEEEQAGRTFFWEARRYSTPDSGVFRFEVMVRDNPEHQPLARMTSFQEASR